MTAPMETMLALLEGVHKSGRGYTARCPAHTDRFASLSIAEGHDSRILLRCFAGCSAAEVVHALGLELKDLFPARRDLPNLTREQRAEAREWRRIADWRAALSVLSLEGTIVAIAGREMARGVALDAADLKRMQVAVDRIEGVRGVLHAN